MCTSHLKAKQIFLAPPFLFLPKNSPSNSDFSEECDSDTAHRIFNTIIYCITAIHESKLGLFLENYVKLVYSTVRSYVFLKNFSRFAVFSFLIAA